MALRITDSEYDTLLARTGKAGGVPHTPLVTKKNKYNAVRKSVDGLSFHSTGEARRYADLKWLAQAGRITNLRLQVRYPLAVNGIYVTTYTADFVYLENGTEVVEDFKGHKTPEYRLKKALMLAVHGVTITETSSRR